jgi:hypothetical protein
MLLGKAKASFSDQKYEARGLAIHYDGKPGQDDRPAEPALQVLRVQSW